MKLNLIALSVMFSSSVFAVELYDITKNYPTGEQAAYEGKIYETQWWANPGQSPADITENSWESPWIYIADDNHVESEEHYASIHYFVRDHHLTAHAFDERYLNPYAVEMNDTHAFVALNSDHGAVKVLDLQTGQVVDEINATDNNLPGYGTIDDITIDENLLFVSANNQTVDIYDLNKDNQLFMSLGTGSSRGENSLNRTKGIAASQNHIFVLDSTKEIKVYSKDVLHPANHLKAPQSGMLSVPSYGNYRSAHMEVIGDYLFFSEFGSYAYVFDLTKLDSAINHGIALEPIRKINLWAHKITQDEGHLIVHTKGKIEFFDIDKLVQSNFSFTNPDSTVTSISGWGITELRDIQSHKGKIITADENFVNIDSIHEVTTKFTTNQSVETVQLKFDDYAKDKASSILINELDHSMIVNDRYTSFKVNSPLKTEFTGYDTIEITNYSAVELTNVNLELNHNSLDKWFTLATLDRIPAFTSITVSVSLFSGEFNTVEKDGVVDLSNILGTSSPIFIAKGLDYRFSSETDKMAQKLSSIKPSWKVNFWDVNNFYDPTIVGGEFNDCGWAYINALYAREWTIMITNLAYIVSQDEFEHVWFNFKDVFGYDMHGKAGATNGEHGLFSQEDYAYWFKALMDRETTTLGVTQKVMSDGSRFAAGVDTFSFYGHYYGNWRDIAKSFGLGFDGKTTFRDQLNHSFADYNGWQRLINDLANYHIRKGDLPYTDDEVNGFYKPENSKYHYRNIDEGYRVHRDPSEMNAVERYFESLMKSKNTAPKK